MADSGLAQEEVWDDSDLVDSWNEAFAEYKVTSPELASLRRHSVLMNVQKYHSIALKGEKVSPPPGTDTNGFTNGDKPSIATAQPDQQDETADSNEYDPASARPLRAVRLLLQPGSLLARRLLLPCHKP